MCSFLRLFQNADALVYVAVYVKPAVIQAVMQGADHGHDIVTLPVGISGNRETFEKRSAWLAPIRQAVRHIPRTLQPPP